MGIFTTLTIIIPMVMPYITTNLVYLEQLFHLSYQMNQNKVESRTLFNLLRLNK